MRAFIALEIPPAWRAALGELQRRAAADATGWRWSRPESIHLTLRFLGEISASRIGTAASLLRDAVASVDSVTLRVTGLGVFPSPRRPRILWAGVVVTPESGRLGHLATIVDAACVAAGMPAAERPFTPHLTLARAVAGTARISAAALPVDCGPTTIDEVVLFRSELGPRGAVHTPLDRFHLGPAPR